MNKHVRTPEDALKEIQELLNRLEYKWAIEELTGHFDDEGKKDQSSPWVVDLSKLFLGVFAVISRILLVVNNPHVEVQVAELLSRHLTSLTTLYPSNDDSDKCLLLQEHWPIRISEDLIISFESIPTLLTGGLPIHIYGIIRKCIRIVNSCASLAILVNNQKQQSQQSQQLPFSSPHVIDELLAEVASVEGALRSGGIAPFHSPTISQVEEAAYAYHGSFGPIQIGIPPETIKTSMKKGVTVPQIYVLPPKLFEKELNLGEVEFPIYWNFFVNKAFINPQFRVVMIGTEEQLERVQVSFRESVFGPARENLFLEEDITPERRAEGYWVDFEAERNFLAYKDSTGKTPPISHFAEFKPFDKNNEALLNHKYKVGGEEKEVAIKLALNNGLLKVYEDEVRTGVLETTAVSQCEGIEESPENEKEREKERETEREKEHDRDKIQQHIAKSMEGTALKLEKRSREEFKPPVLGVTFIGTSHGFDAKGSTTGFIIWINGSGVLVDPPVETPDFLANNGIPYRLVDKAILTHCHSDHDSGLIKIILAGTKIEVYTTKTVNESYKRKLNAITGIEDVGQFYTFKQVKIGQLTNINGAKVEFDYSFHTVPTIRFKLTFGGKSLSYSSDTHYNPQAFAKLVSEGIINYQREVSLRMFLFDADMIIHESGVPPIHTDIADLNNLPEVTKKKLFVVHCSGIPETVERRLGPSNEKVSVKVTNLKIPKTGVENTVVVPVGKFFNGFSRATKLFSLFCDTWYFRNISASHISRLFSACTEVRYENGDIIIRKGDESSHFYLIEYGTVHVLLDQDESPDQVGDSDTGVGSQRVLPLGPGESFGESALLKPSVRPKRIATVVAASKCHLLALRSHDFFEIVGDKALQARRPTAALETDLAKIQKYRPFLRDSLSRSSLFNRLKEDQIESLAASINEELVFMKNAVICNQGDEDNSLCIVKEGSVLLRKKNPDMPEEAPAVEFMQLDAGDTFGEMALITGLPRTATAVAACDGTVILHIPQEDFMDILNRYQNIRFHILTLVSERLKETERLTNRIREEFGNNQKN